LRAKWSGGLQPAIATIALLALISGHFAGWCCVLTCPSATVVTATTSPCHEDASDGLAISAGHACNTPLITPQPVADRTTPVTNAPAIIVLPWRPVETSHITGPLAFSLLPADAGPPIASPLPLRI
jgi:hypothetical protein